MFDSLQLRGLHHTKASLSFTISQSLLKLLSTESVMPCNHLILCCPLLLLPSIFPSITLFQWVSSLHQGAKELELKLQHQSCQWIFRTDFLFSFLNAKSIFIRNKKENHMTVIIFKINMIGTKYKNFIHCYRNYARGLIWIIAFTIDCLPPAVFFFFVLFYFILFY